MNLAQLIKSVVPPLAAIGLCFLSTQAVDLETATLKLSVAPDTGRYEIVDKQSGVTWHSNPFRAQFGEVTCVQKGQQKHAPLDHAEIQQTARALQLTFHPLEDSTAVVRVQIRLISTNAVELSYDAEPTLEIERIRLLDESLWSADSEQGYAAVPVREGMLVPADSGRAFRHEFDTFAYEGCHMEMFGLVKAGSAALVTWDDPYAAVELRSVLTNSISSAKQILAPSLLLRRSARACRIEFLGKGGYAEIAKAYRSIAKQKGRLVTWDEKLRGHPERAGLFGASNYKLWSALSRQMSEDSQQEQSARVTWTFAEAAEVAEHLKWDLKLDRVLFILGGWIHRGYDNQHPDILPTAPECGGDTAFADCARRVMALGYLFCLHDNYQDIYRDSPSWDERFIMKSPQGSLIKGGHWAGGRAYLTCSKMALELAQRPQNLAAIKKLSGANAYFIDTTYAAGLQECFDPNHPLTRQDDTRWKQALSDYAREVFGIFGSECGREWAIPHSDFFEGLTGVSGGYYHNKNLMKELGATVVPLFEFVYRDCIALYGKYGYDPAQAAEYVLHHISIGRPLNYHSIPPHLFWKQNHSSLHEGVSSDSSAPPSKERDAAIFTRADSGWAEGFHKMDRFVKNTHEILSPLNEFTARMPMTEHQFLSADRKIQRTVFGAGPGAAEVIVNLSAAEFRCRSKVGGDVVLPPNGFLIEMPQFVAFCASRWNNREYGSPALFTLRSTTSRPLSESKKIRVFHGFGDSRLRLGATDQVIAREAIIAGLD